MVTEALKELNQAGWPDSRLAEEFGVSRVTVTRWRRGLITPAAPGMLLLAVDALRRRDPPGKRNMLHHQGEGTACEPAFQDSLTELHRRGWSDSALGQAFQVNQPTVSLWRNGHTSPSAPGMLVLAAEELEVQEPPGGRNRARVRGIRRPRSDRQVKAPSAS